MKKNVIVITIMLISVISGIKAQDTIDLEYYRYDHNYWGSSRMVNNPETGELEVQCPNGDGFRWLYVMRNFDTIDGYLGLWDHADSNLWSPYMYYMLSKDQDVYGISIALDGIDDFTNGDSLIVILCDISDDHTRFVQLDSIVIKGGEVGKRRWMEVPIEYEDILDRHGAQENCIDTILYRQVLEFYFDRPKHVNGPYLWWKVRVSVDNGSSFLFSTMDGARNGLTYFFENCEAAVVIDMTDMFYPIITPLPEWEEPSMAQVIPYPEGAVIPDPQDPQDPEDPEYPEDPDNPGGDEGIDNFEIQNSEFEINIYPNPASGYAVVTCDTPIRELSLCDLNGRMVLTLRNCGGSAKVDTSVLAPGVYMLKVTTDAGTATRKLVVKP